MAVKRVSHLAPLVIVIKAGLFKVNEVKLGAAPACVTAMVLVMPPPVTVMVALRVKVLVFAVAVRVRLPLLVPLAGETVSQEGSLLVANHETFEVTETLVLLAIAFEAQEDVLSVRLATSPPPVPACVTVMVSAIPPPVTVMYPVLLDTSVFDVVDREIMPLLEPLGGYTVNQEVAELVAVQDVFEYTDTPAPNEFFGAAHELVLSVRVVAAKIGVLGITIVNNIIRASSNDRDFFEILCFLNMI